MGTWGSHIDSSKTNETPNEKFQYKSLNSQQQDNPFFLQNSDSPDMKLMDCLMALILKNGNDLWLLHFQLGTN